MQVTVKYWASTRDLSELDALVVAHNAGESRLRSYPVLPAITARFILNVRERMAAWSSADVLATAAPLTSASLPASASPSTVGDVSSVDPACTGVATQPTASG